MILKIGDNFYSEFTITSKIYEGFIKIFNDNNPMHVNTDFAKNYGFIEKVMHGNILNGFISNFVGEQLPEKNVVIISQNIKFNNPVYLNDTLQFNAKVFEIYESVNVINFKYKFVNQKKIVVAKGQVQIKTLQK